VTSSQESLSLAKAILSFHSQRGQAATKQVLKNKLSPTDKKTTNG
jgi:hypothetical protein